MRASQQSVVGSGFSRTGGAPRTSHRTWDNHTPVVATVTVDLSRPIGPAEAGPYDSGVDLSSHQGWSLPCDARASGAGVNVRPTCSMPHLATPGGRCVLHVPCTQPRCDGDLRKSRGTALARDLLSRSTTSGVTCQTAGPATWERQPKVPGSRAALTARGAMWPRPHGATKCPAPADSCPRPPGVVFAGPCRCDGDEAMTPTERFRPTRRASRACRCSTASPT
jgi:hypothetical protein